MNKNNICITIIMIILFVVALGVFAGIYFVHAIYIDKRFNKALENYSLNIQTIISNTAIDKTVITNELENSITINNEFIINDEIANSFKSTFDINTRMLESSMSEIMKNSNDLLSFWFAFLSVIMIVFTFAGIFINNNILTESKEKLADVNNKANEIIENIKNQAADETKKLIEENNINIQISNLFNSAYQADNNKDYNSSINYYNKIIKMIDDLLKRYDKNSKEYSKYKNNYFIAYNNRGISKYKLEQYREAIKDYDRAIKLNINDSEAYNNRGCAKAKLRLYEEAIKDFDRAIELNINYSEAYNNRGTAKADFGDYKGAIEDFDKAIELNPNYSDNYFNKALSKQSLANTTENENEKNKLIEEAYNNFMKGYKLADDKLKDEYKQRIIKLSKKGHEIAKKICDEMGWEY